MENNTLLARLLDDVIAYDGPNAHRIAHLIKVHGYARAIGLLEALDETTQVTLEAAAIVHDIGIKICEEKYDGRSSGNLQEKEGPRIARELLSNLGFPESVIDRVAFLVGHHHTYHDIQGLDYQILVESDFLVNLQEHQSDIQTIKHTYAQIFRTESGKRFCSMQFGL
ncbi:MAG: HD domain-containing protein [Sphaerochaeta sp.]|uniref:HD domain-containing protein n=1 Tax=Sphaerochaeta sp. TaxID=1972642 RepID=UPI002FCCB526